MVELLAASAISVTFLMVITWIVSLAVDDVSIVDMIWGAGFVLVAWVTFFLAEEPGTRGLLLAILVTIWGLRLSGYITWRKLGKPEDRRYAEMREKTPETFWIVSLFKVFLFQGLLMWLISFPLVVVNAEPREGLIWLDAVAIGVWAVGFFFETVGDVQLARFKARPDTEGEVMDEGLWRYTRHPNYFGDFSVWWGHYLVALAAGAWWTVFSPIIMSFMLLRVSGVTRTEESIESRRPGYEEYARTTNTFFPGPPARD